MTRLRSIIFFAFVVALGVIVWLNVRPAVRARSRDTILPTASLTVLTRLSSTGRVVTHVPLLIREISPAANRQPVQTTVQTNGGGAATVALPVGQYIIQSIKTDQYIGTLPVGLQKSVTVTLTLVERPGANNSNQQ